MDAGDPGPAVFRPPPGWQTVPDPPQSLFSPRHLCFHIFLTVLLFLWFIIELPRSDSSIGCYIILSNSAPSARPLSDSHLARASWGTAVVWQVWPLSDGWEGWAGQEPRGAKHAMAGCEREWRLWHGDMCPGLTCYDTGTACSRHEEALSRATTALSRDLPDNDILIPQEIFNWIIVTKYCLLNQVVSYCNLLSSPWSEYNVFCTISRARENSRN